MVPKTKQINEKIWIGSLICSLIVVTVLYLLNGIIDDDLFEYYIGLPTYIIIPAIPVGVSIWALKVSGKIQIISPKTLIFFTGSFGCWFVGEQIWILYGYLLDIDPFPSIADFFYIVGYFLMFVGLMIFLTPLRKSISKISIVFSVIISAFVLIPSLAVSFMPNLEYDIIDFFFALLYPVLDILLLVPAIMILLISMKGERNSFWLVMLLGLIVFVAADTFFLFVDISDLYYEGHPVDIIWLYSYLMFSFAIYKIVHMAKNFQTTLNIQSFEIEQKYDTENQNTFGIPIVLLAINMTILMLLVGINYFWKQNEAINFTLLISIIFFVVIAIFSIIVYRLNQKTNFLLGEQFSIQSNLRRAINVASDIAITDKNGTITYVNDEFCNSSKYSRKELHGENHRILKSGYHSSEFYKNMWDTITAGKVWHDIIQNKAKDGNLYWNDMFIVPFFNKNNEIQEFISIRRDISERIKLNEEKIKNERMITLGSFTSRLAHDLRNPLSIIQVSLENMKMLYGTNEIKQNHFDKISRSIGRMTHQIDDVLSYVKGEPVAMTMVRFSELLNEATDSLNIPDRIKLIIPKTDVKFICDQKQFAIAINNLILNSIQSIVTDGTIEITIDENIGEIIIKVIDSGKGIIKGDIDKIFEPLYTTKLQGTGLGLISVKAIIELHGGIISVTLPPTIFTIIIPKTHD